MSVRASFLSLVVLSLGLSGFAQLTTNTNSNRFGGSNSAMSDRTNVVSGTVTTIDGQNVPDAKVELRDATGQAVNSAYTDARGHFMMGSVQYGTYEIVAVKGTSQCDDRVVVAGGDVPVNLRLPVRATAEDGSATVSVASFRVPEKARKMYAKADEALHKNKLEDAAKLAGKALEIFPDYAEALTLQGILKMNDNKVDEAMADFDHAIKSDANYALAYTTMGAAYNQLGKYKEAERVLRRSATIKPDSWQVYFELSKTMLGEGDYKEALKFVTKASEISQEYAPVHLVKAHALLGMKLYQDAVGELELYLNREPSGVAADSARKTLTAAKAFATTAQK